MKKGSKNYYLNNTHSLFIVALITMAVTFIATWTIATSFDALTSSTGMLYAFVLFLGLFISVLFGAKKTMAKFNVLLSLFGALFALISSAGLFFVGPDHAISAFFFWITQILLILFLFSAYFSIQAFKK